MSSPTPRSGRPARLSPFFRDLAAPISSHRRTAGRFSTPTVVSPDLPPPPVLTLDDRPEDFSPEPGLGEVPPLSPVPTALRLDRRGSLSPSPSRSSSSYFLRTRAEADGPGSPTGRGKNPEGSIWVPSSSVNGGERETGQRAPADGMVEPSPGALVALPPSPPAEIAPPVSNAELDTDQWVTVFGFPPCDTNLVIRELEKCGTIAKHVPGPRDANWIYILFENSYDAQKALKKNGTQLNSMLIIGVRPVNPVHRQHLKEKLKKINGGFMVSKPSKLTDLSSSLNHLKASSGYNSDKRLYTAGIIATPANSLVSKFMDLVFGI